MVFGGEPGLRKQTGSGILPEEEVRHRGSAGPEVFEEVRHRGSAGPEVFVAEDRQAGRRPTQSSLAREKRKAAQAGGLAGTEPAGCRAPRGSAGQGSEGRRPGDHPTARHRGAPSDRHGRLPGQVGSRAGDSSLLIAAVICGTREAGLVLGPGRAGSSRTSRATSRLATRRTRAGSF